MAVHLELNRLRQLNLASLVWRSSRTAAFDLKVMEAIDLRKYTTYYLYIAPMHLDLWITLLSEVLRRSFWKMQVCPSCLGDISFACRGVHSDTSFSFIFTHLQRPFNACRQELQRRRTLFIVIHLLYLEKWDGQVECSWVHSRVGICFRILFGRALRKTAAAEPRGSLNSAIGWKRFCSEVVDKGSCSGEGQRY